MLERGVDSFLFENSACVCNVTSIEDQVSLLEEVYMQDVSSASPSPNVELHYVENITNHEEERYSIQYKDKEAESYTSSDEGELVTPMYCHKHLQHMTKNQNCMKIAFLLPNLH